MSICNVILNKGENMFRNSALDKHCQMDDLVTKHPVENMRNILVKVCLEIFITSTLIVVLLH